MPVISVILPVYNGEKYLREAVDSILNQTFTDFELLVIDDGSTDDSARIISAYADSRLVPVRNEKNLGLIATLNKAIDLAKGRYTARMDADDIALPDRFRKQLDFIEKHRFDVLASTVRLIDENGLPLPDWEDDVRHTTPEEIKLFLAKDNCVAHPSVLVKTGLLKKYRYRYNQKYSEDYDLWLRMLADGLTIGKIREPLLLHRILPTSATRFKKINSYLRLAKVKFRFLWQQAKAGRFSAYHARIAACAITDLAKAGGKEIKALLKS